MSDWKDYESINPNDLGDTYQTTQTTTDENGKQSTTILDNFRVDDVNGEKVQQYSSTPETTTAPNKSNTGSGLEAALGTDYSWNTKAEERAGLDYESTVLETKANYLTNRQEIESTGLQYQDQLAMQQYSQNQSNEKAGWTGGYILDTERQMAYLKQTIQSQMYGQMELQKYGYDTSLAAARLAYDTNKYDLALEYYNTALSRAVSEAEITGYYVSPETSEMLNEYAIASRVLNDDTAKPEDKLRADHVLNAVYKWFEDHGISKQGVETYSHIVEERTNKMSVEATLKYIDTANKQISSDVFTKVDEKGNAKFSEDNSSVETINFKTISQQELLEYIENNKIATQQFYGYMDSNLAELENNFYDWCVSNKYLKATTDEKNKTSYEPDNKYNYEELLYLYLKSSASWESLTSKLGQEQDDNSKTKLIDILKNWDFDFNLPGSEYDGTRSWNSLIDSVQKASEDKILNAFTPDENGNIHLTKEDKTVKLAGQAGVTVTKVTPTNSLQESTIYFLPNKGEPDGTGVKLFGVYLDDTSKTAACNKELTEIFKETYNAEPKLEDICYIDGVIYAYHKNFNTGNIEWVTLQNGSCSSEYDDLVKDFGNIK